MSSDELHKIAALKGIAELTTATSEGASGSAAKDCNPDANIVTGTPTSKADQGREHESVGKAFAEKTQPKEIDMTPDCGDAAEERDTSEQESAVDIN